VYEDVLTMLKKTKLLVLRMSICKEWF